MNIQLDAEFHFLISDITAGNQARLKEKLDSIHFLSKRSFFVCWFFKLILY